MPKGKPTTIWLSEEDHQLAAERKEEYGIPSLSALVRMWLRYPPKKR